VNWLPTFSFVTGLVLAPLLLGIINRTKSAFGGRRGPPLCQAYFDLAKLLRKGVVYSRTTTWIFRAGPMIGLSAAVAALSLLPVAGTPAVFSFGGDLVLFAYGLGLMRFCTVLAALDTGSSFEGMGASREVQFSALAEPALILGLAALARMTGSLSLSSIYSKISPELWQTTGPAMALAAAAFLIVCLVENSRIPFDDPNTHLELTMIHEVMVLDHSGPDLAFILYGAALKLWVLGALIVNIFLTPLGLTGGVALGGLVLGMMLLAVVIGIVESVMARLPLLRVPQLLIGAGSLSLLAFVLAVRFTS
jgi:formate hydrogenlyase subunit 4